MKEEIQGIRTRTKQFALRIIRLYSALPKAKPSQVIGSQILRSGTSVGAHYREACRAKSDADFISKMQGALQELDETEYWLELLIESGIMTEKKLGALLRETTELTAIFTAMTKKVKKRVNS
jgi:four helix bundle protein